VGVLGAILRRAILPLALAIAGLAAIVEGVFYHSIRVLVETKTTKKIDVPLPTPPGLPLNGRSTRGMAFSRPAVVKRTVTQTELLPLMISEPETTRDVTVGGLERLVAGEHAGELQRTYSGGKGSALCPT
jgi:hypothetical protein